MSRLPPIPPASKPVHGPEAVAKTSVDISHRVRHQTQRATGPFEEPGEPSRDRGAAAPNGALWMLVAATAALGLGYLAGRRIV